MASSPPGTLRFSFLDNSFTIEIHFDVHAGTGRFEGATGQIETKGGGLDFGTGSSSQYGTNRGVIYGENIRRRDNSEKDDREPITCCRSTGSFVVRGIAADVTVRRKGGAPLDQHLSLLDPTRSRQDPGEGPHHIE